MHKLISNIKSFLSNIGREIFLDFMAAYETVVLRTPEEYEWKYLSDDEEITGFILKNSAGRKIVEFSDYDGTLYINGKCRSVFSVNEELDIFAVQRFAMRFLRRETDLSGKFDSRYELLMYDACYDERFPAKKCIGTWQERGTDRWLTLEGHIVAQYNVSSCIYRFKKGDWKKIDSIGILWNSEEDFRNFLERQVSAGVKEAV